MQPYYSLMPTSVPNFNFLALLVSEIKRGSQNLMWSYYPPGVPHTLKLLCVLQVGYLARSACQISASYLYASCSYANKCISHRLRHILCFHYVPQIVRGFEGEDVKILCSNPPKGTTLREYTSVGVSHVKIGSTA